MQEKCHRAEGDPRAAMSASADLVEEMQKHFVMPKLCWKHQNIQSVDVTSRGRCQMPPWNTQGHHPHCL